MTSIPETASELGLLREEYDRIVEILGREPNFTELCIYSVMWSEHCSYKNSILWLKQLPRDSERLLAKAGEENAGLVDIGGGLACSFKIESHNHPSAIEPYQGAATGVGGINRDIFTTGARPIAQLNSLRFGSPRKPKNARLLKGVVKGIGDYGNAFGIPTVGGEVYFHECYDNNPLVNAFSAGIVRTDKIAKAVAYGAGNPVFIIGAATGKDGIRGAAFASKDISEDSAKDLPSVQVGDPFTEKLLLEATLEIIDSGRVVGIQDMGAAGIICSTSEMSAKGKHGMDIRLDAVPMRQPNMKPYELLLSESQERMLVVMEKGSESVIATVCEKWDLFYAQIGEVTATERLRFFMDGTLTADVPADSLVLGGGAPVYERDYREPDYYQVYKKFDIRSVPEPSDLPAVARALLSNLNVCSRRRISEQYDSMVGTATLTQQRPADAAVVKVKGTDKAIVITVDCNARYVHADPEQGCAIAVAEACRNIVCSGGEPVAVTNCLNFGNPYDPEVYWQFVGAVKGMKKACERFNTPVTGGNVSFYNQSEQGPVFPTPVIGMLGIMNDKSRLTTLDFKEEGDAVWLIGRVRNCIASSEYLASYHQISASPAPYFDLEEEYLVQEFVKRLIAEGMVRSAHDVSEGGLLIALYESAMPQKKGFALDIDFQGIRKDAYLFGESQGRIVIGVQPDREAALEKLIRETDMPAVRLGRVTSGVCTVNGAVFPDTKEAALLYEQALPALWDEA